jgi:HlyD family secretion protein
MKLTRKHLILFGAVAATGAAIAGVVRPDPVEVDVAAAERRDLLVTVDAEGQARVRQRYTIAAPVAGRVARIDLPEGTRVEKGDVVAVVTPTPLDPQGAEQAGSRVAAAVALAREADTRVSQARLALDQERRTAERAGRLAAAGAISDDDRERAELTRSIREGEYAAALSRARAAAADVRAARASLLGLAPSAPRAQVKVRAPAPGRVLRVPERSERVIGAGTPLVELGDSRSLEIVVDVLSTDAVRILPGAEVIVEQWGGEHPLAGQVRLVEPAAFTRVSALGVEEQRVNVLIDVPSPPETIGDGYRVETRTVVWRGRRVLTVPTSAPFQVGEQPHLFVVADGRARLRRVQIGHVGEASAEVLGGLSDGETVILFPSDAITHGVRVRARGAP